MSVQHVSQLWLWLCRCMPNPDCADDHRSIPRPDRRLAQAGRQTDRQIQEQGTRDETHAETRRQETGRGMFGTELACAAS